MQVQYGAFYAIAGPDYNNTLARRVGIVGRPHDAVAAIEEAVDAAVAVDVVAGGDHVGAGIEERLGGIEQALEKLGNEVEALRKKLPATPPRRAAAKKATPAAAKKTSA